MTALIVAHALLGLFALLVLGFVSLVYRGGSVPRTDRLADSLQEFAGRIAPGEAPPNGVLSSPDRDRAIRDRLERAERQVRKVVTAGRG